MLPTQSAQGFQHWQIGLARAVVFNALPLAYPHLTSWEQFGVRSCSEFWICFDSGLWTFRDSELFVAPNIEQKGFQKRGLANPRLTGDEDNLALPVCRPL